MDTKKLLTLAAVLMIMTPSAVTAAENLRLAPGVSYTSDVGTVFPLVGDRMTDYTIESGRPALIFFGATGDLNTNRQAKRLVALYAKRRDNTKYIVVNVDSQDEAARELVRKYYPGYVPAQLLLDKDGHTIWTQVGEISRKRLGGQI